MKASHHYALFLFGCAALGIAMFAAGLALLHEPLGLALWSVVAAIVLLPLAYVENGVKAARYVAACGAIVAGTWFIGSEPAIVLAAVAWSLLGGAQLLVAIRIPAAMAIALTMLGAALSFTWPIWMAGILATHDLGPWLQRIIDLSPAFAMNVAISPEDPLTHRPLAYKLMNLGQDVNYAMPGSAVKCILLHACIGVVGLIGRGWTRMDADRRERRAALSSRGATATKDLN